MELTDILICPHTAGALRFDDADSIACVERPDLKYPVIDGIIDFLARTEDPVARSYDAIAPRYDKYITSATLFLKLCNTVVWGIGDDREYVDTVLSFMPSPFDGVLLDVPVGTGIFTSALYAAYPSATIIGLDSSMGMLQKARQRFAADGLTNVRLIRADVTSLPFKDGAFDIVLSMNGLHVFADKPRAIAQMQRVLRKNATLIACGYVKGVKRIADWFLRHFAARKGFFNPPFFTLDNIASQIDGFTIIRRGNVKSLVYFEAIKDT